MSTTLEAVHFTEPGDEPARPVDQLPPPEEEQPADEPQQQQPTGDGDAEDDGEFEPDEAERPDPEEGQAANMDAAIRTIARAFEDYLRLIVRAHVAPTVVR